MGWLACACAGRVCCVVVCAVLCRRSVDKAIAVAGAGCDRYCSENAGAVGEVMQGAPAASLLSGCSRFAPSRSSPAGTACSRLAHPWRGACGP